MITIKLLPEDEHAFLLMHKADKWFTITSDRVVCTAFTADNMTFNVHGCWQTDRYHPERSRPGRSGISPARRR